MATAKMETAAERYRRIKTQKEASEPLFDVTCEGAEDSCGMVWKGRKVGLEFWVTSGILPMHLAETMLDANNKGNSPEKVLKKLAAKEIAQSIEFSARVVRKTAAEPQIVEDPKKLTEIGYDEVMTCCFKRLLDWQMKGGDEAARLANFPSE